MPRRGRENNSFLDRGKRVRRSGIALAWLGILIGIGTVIALYLIINTFFASIYVWVGGIENARAGSFVDAFFFSVETIATIGYGHMAPVSLAAHCRTHLTDTRGPVNTFTATLFARCARSR